MNKHQEYARLGEIDCESPNDFNQYYSGGRLFAMPDGENLLPCAHNSVDGNAMYYTVLKGPEGPFTKRSENWAVFRKLCVFGLPMLGTCVNGDTYKYLWSFARRQSVKGLALNGLSEWVPDRYGLWTVARERMDRSMSRRSTETIWHIYNPKYWEFPEAVALLTKGKRIGCPLDSKFGLYIAKDHANILLSYRARTLGEVVGKQEIKLYKENAEILDFIRLSLPYVEVDV